jgi:hypothetical protein
LGARRKGDRGESARGGGNNTNRFNALNDDDLYQPNITEDEYVDMERSNKHNNFYNGAPPWVPPQNRDESVFHAPYQGSKWKHP